MIVMPRILAAIIKYAGSAGILAPVALRRNLLLAVLAVLLAIVAYDHWPEPAPPPDPATLSISQLLADDSQEGWEELTERTWRLGPDAFEEVWSLDRDARVALALGFCRSYPGNSDAEMMAKWRDRLLRVQAEDADKEVRTFATYALCMFACWDLENPAPVALLEAIRTMIQSSASEDRMFACDLIRLLGDRAVGLHTEVLSMDVRRDDGLGDCRARACWALGAVGVFDEQIASYLFAALRDAAPATRQFAAYALGALGVASAEVVRELGACIEGDDADLRVAALTALSDLPLEPSTADHYLQVAMQSRADFDPFLSDRVACVGSLALKVEDQSSHANTVAWLRNLLREKGSDVPLAASCVIVRIATAGADQQLLDEFLHELMGELEYLRDDAADGALMFMAQPVLEALVDVCLWRRDQALREALAETLQSCERNDSMWSRVWSREQLARLGL